MRPVEDALLPLEDGSASQKLRQYAADAPQVNRRRVVREAEHDFRSTIPARRDVFRHEARIGRLWIEVESTGEAKVADLELAVGIDEKISGFQVSMQD